MFEHRLNEILLSTWRDRNERLKAAQKPLEDRWWNYACDEIGVPRGTTFEDVPKEKHAQWRAFWALLYENYRAYRVPEGFEKTLIPPQLPQGLAAYILQYDTYGKASWEEVTREVSLAQPVPADPIRVRHDKFFSEVFTEVRKNLGCDFTTEYVPNAYCGAKCEPWFRFILGANTLIVGPRKRVTTIRVTAPQGLNTRKIRAAAVKVETTYTADGGWQSDIVTAHELEVHAWDKKQLVEFLTIIGTESLAMVPA